jgi:hypothetical protein
MKKTFQEVWVLQYILMQDDFGLKLKKREAMLNRVLKEAVLPLNNCNLICHLRFGSKML